MANVNCVKETCAYPETCNWNNMCVTAQLEISNAVKHFEPQTNKVGVLLCHGFLSRHEQMIPLSDYIYETLGWETSLVQLSGHGYDEENITNVTWNDWVSDVKVKYKKLKEHCDEVYMVGFSLGGCVCAYVSTLKSIKPNGLVIINGVFGVKNVFNKLLPGVMVYNKLCEKFNLQKFMLESITNNSEAPELNQPLVNLSATNELRKISKISQAALQDVLCPTFVIQEYNDPTVFYGSGVKAFKKLGSTLKRFQKTKLNTHLTIVDKGFECGVFFKISKFLTEVHRNKFVNIAHRGASGTCTENTFASFEKAIEVGCDMIELDVQWIGNKIRVFHDSSAKRMFGIDKKMSDLTESEAAELTYSNCEKIPTLEQVLDFINGRVHVNIEIKDSTICSNVVNVVEKYKDKHEWLNRDIVLSSFSHATMNGARRMRSDINVSYLLHETYSTLDEIKSLKSHYFNYNLYSLNLPLESVTEEIIEFCNKNKMKLFVFTVNKLEQIRWLRERGVNGVFTDHPELIQ